MKRWILFSLGILLLVSVLALREWVILKEVRALQAELSDSLSQSVQSSESFERLEQVSQSFFVYDRYLEPVLTTAHRMLWPHLRHQTISLWEAKVHRELEDSKYVRLVKLRETIQAEISKIKNESKPGKDRLKEIIRLSSSLDLEAARSDLLQKEIEAIEASLKEMDEKLFAEVRELGLQHLKALRLKIRKMDEKQFRTYISSMEFIEETQKPVVHKIMEISVPELRKNMWDEYSKTLIRVLNRRSRVLAQASSSKEVAAATTSPVQSFAELLKREYEKDEAFFSTTP